MSGGILSPRAVTAGGERFAVRTNRSEIAMRDFMLGVLLLSSLLLKSEPLANNLVPMRKVFGFQLCLPWNLVPITPLH
jgi:hypothetical protein